MSFTFPQRGSDFSFKYSITDAEGNTITYDYDEFGNISSVAYPGGQEVAYTYDKNGRLVKTQRSDGSAETRTYDKAGNLVAIKDVKKDGTVINDYTYNYDQGGNITAITGKSVAKDSQRSATDTTVPCRWNTIR